MRMIALRSLAAVALYGTFTLGAWLAAGIGGLLMALAVVAGVEAVVGQPYRLRSRYHGRRKGESGWFTLREAVFWARVLPRQARAEAKYAERAAAGKLDEAP